MIFWLKLNPGSIGHCVIYSGPSVHGYLGMVTPCLQNHNYTLRLVLIFKLTKDGMQQHIIIVTRDINCISMELKQKTLKYCFKFGSICKAIYYSPLLVIKECMPCKHAAAALSLRHAQDLPVNGDVFFSLVINIDNDRLSFHSIYSWSWKLSIYC